MELKIRLCKDCAHYRAAQSAMLDECAKRHSNPALVLVRGEKGDFGYCDQTRLHDYWCGPDGKWFEAK